MLTSLTAMRSVCGESDLNDNSKSDDLCMRAWRQIDERNLRQWRGLPSNCSYSSFDQKFQRVSDQYGIGKLGVKVRDYRYRVYQHEGYPGDLKAWYHDDRLVLIEGWYPVLDADVPSLLDEFGEADLYLDYRLDLMPLAQGAWVYAGRGLTLFMDLDGQAVMGVALYRPGTAEDYEYKLHPIDEWDELPP